MDIVGAFVTAAVAGVFAAYAAEKLAAYAARLLRKLPPPVVDDDGE